MIAFRLDLYSFGGEPIGTEHLEAGEMPELAAKIRQAICRIYERPESFVDIDLKQGRFRIGAGFWSQKGRLGLDPGLEALGA